MIKFILITVTILAALLICFFTFNSYIYNEKQADTNEQAIAAEPAAISDLITVTSPLPGSTVGNPIQIQGTARGFWFFEASAPVTVVNWDGLIIGEGYITAEGDWMTEEFVPFSGIVSYTLPADSYSTRGAIIMKKDNPSGLPENDKALEFPIELIK